MAGRAISVEYKHIADFVSNFSLCQISFTGLLETKEVFFKVHLLKSNGIRGKVWAFSFCYTVCPMSQR